MRHYSTRAYFVITLCHAFRHILILLIYVIYKHDRKLQVIRKAAHAGTNWFYHLQLFNLLYHENWVKRVSLWGNKQTFLLYMNPSCKHAYWQQNLVYFALIHYAPTHHFTIITYTDMQSYALMPTLRILKVNLLELNLLAIYMLHVT
jgi:hypothetical protein